MHVPSPTHEIPSKENENHKKTATLGSLNETNAWNDGKTLLGQTATMPEAAHTKTTQNTVMRASSVPCKLKEAVTPRVGVRR